MRLKTVGLTVAVHNDASDLQPTAEAVRAAYEQYRAELRNFLARQSRDAQNSEDLVQEIYVQLLRFPPREDLREPQAYLYRIAWHVVSRANLRARREALPHDVADLERLIGAGSDGWSDDFSERLGNEQQLSRTLMQLPRVCQAALLLCKRDGLSYKEIAAELNISVHTVKKYIARGIAHFKTQIVDRHR